MSHLNIGLSNFENSRSRVRSGYPFRALTPGLRVLASAVSSALNSNGRALAADEVGMSVTNSCSYASIQDTTQGCRAFVSDADYQHLVEIGHWHHRRQRRRAGLF